MIDIEKRQEPSDDHLSTQENTIIDILTEIKISTDYVEVIFEKPLLIRVIFYLIFFNPLIELIKYISIKFDILKYESEKKNFKKMKNFLNSDEKLYLNLCIMAILSIFNIIILCSVKENIYKILLLLLNNLYLGAYALSTEKVRGKQKKLNYILLQDQ